MNTVLVATDLSQKDEKLLYRGIQFAAETNATLHALHVHYTLRVPSVVDSSVEEHNDIKDKISDLIKTHPLGAKIEYKIYIADGGRVYDQIDQYAQSIRADLVIMGASKVNENAPDVVLSTLERVLAEDSYPVLIVVRDAEDFYSDIAVYAPYERSVAKALNIIAPVMQHNDVNIHSYLGAPIKGLVFLGRLRQIHRERKEKKLRKEIASIVGRQFIFQKHKQGKLSDLPKEVSSLNIEMLALESLQGSLFHGTPQPKLREVLGNPPCDLLMIGRA